MIFVFPGCNLPLPEADISITKNADSTFDSSEILGNVTTFAGKAVYAGDNGPLKDAGFYLPNFMAYDSSGNLYVNDQNVVRKINPSGIVSTLAGSSNQSGSTDGTGIEARFSTVAGIAIDRSDNIFVADYGNHKIRKITPAGVVTTFAGSGVASSVNGTGTFAGFNRPFGITIDDLDNLYVTDSSNHTIRKITPAGVVTTFAGAAGSFGRVDSIGTMAKFKNPRGITIDHAGNLFVADTSNNLIRKITSGGVVTTFAGSGLGNIDGPGISARFNYPFGITFDHSGNLYLTDSYNCSIRMISADAVVTTFAGSGSCMGWVDGTGSSARFSYPRGVVFDNSGNLIVTDTNNYSLRSINSSGVVTTLAGPYKLFNGTGSAARFNTPIALALDSQRNVFVADNSNHTIRKITPTGIVTTFAGQEGVMGSSDGTGVTARFNSPNGIAIDRSDNLYVTDSENSTIRKITPAGVVTTFAGTAGATGSTDGTGVATRFNIPQGIAIDRENNLYVADSENFTIRKITPASVVSTFAGTAGNYGHVDDTGAAAQFYYPISLTVDHEGNIFVADCDLSDSDFYGIRKITPTGEVSTVAGRDYSTEPIDGPGLSASFSGSFGIVSDGAGNLYVSDEYYGSIRKVDSNYNVTTFAGSSSRQFGRTDGQGSEATFMNPRGIAFDPSGALYIADPGNRNIRKIY